MDLSPIAAVGNSTTLSPVSGGLPAGPRGAAAFLIGLFIVLGASCVNALGLNLQRRAHLALEASPKSQRRPQWQSPLWVIGLALYVLSQLVGSTLALQYLRAEYVAPLGSTSLIFNCGFAHFLTGASIARQDVLGTALVIVGVIGVIALSNLRDRTILPNYDDNLSLGVLHSLWQRPAWIAYIVIFTVATLVLWWLSGIADDVLRERQTIERDEPVDELASYGASRRAALRAAHGAIASARRLQQRFRRLLTGRLESWTASKPDIVLQRTAGIMHAVTGGLLSGQTITYAKSVIGLITSGASSYVSALFILLVVFLAITAVAQIVALNKGIKVFSPTVVVPFFFAFYSLSAFITSLIFLQQFPQYSSWTLVLISISGLVLLSGVAVLSAKKLDGPRTTAPSRNPEDDDLEAGGDVGLESLPELGKSVDRPPNGLLTRRDSAPPTETVWAIGDASVDSAGADDSWGDAKDDQYTTLPPRSDSPDDDEFGDLQTARSKGASCALR